MPVPEWSGSDHRRYKDDKRNRIGMDSRGTDHVYRDGAAGGGAAWRVQDHLVNISEVNKRGELFSSYEARRVETAIPGNNGPNSKLAPLTVRGNEVDEPAARATIVGEIVLIEGGGGGAGVIGMYRCIRRSPAKWLPKRRREGQNLTTSPPGTLK